MAQKTKKSGGGKKKIKYFDYTLLFIIIFLVGFGLVMLYSTSSYNAQLKMNDSAYYLKKQLFASILGFCGMFVMARTNYHFWLNLSWLAYLGSLGLCVAVIFKGTNLNGSTRWLKIGPLSFQPSELAKISVILFLSALISLSAKRVRELATVFKLLMVIAPVVIIVAMSNLSTAIIILGISICLIFVASPKYLQFFLMGGLVAAFGAIYIFAERYRADRLLVWLHPEDFEKGYQTLQGHFFYYLRGAGPLWCNLCHFAVFADDLAFFGYRQQCPGFVRRIDCSRDYGTYCDPGYFKYCSCDQFHPQYRGYAPVYQLRGDFGSNPFDGDGAGIKRITRH